MKSNIFEVSSKIAERNFHNSAQNNSAEQHSEQYRKPSSQQWDFSKESWKTHIMPCAQSWVTGRRIHLSISCWLHFPIWMIQYQCLYAKNYKAGNTYHQVFCYSESVDTKWENPMVYAQTLWSVFVQGIVKVGYSPSLLFSWTLVSTESALHDNYDTSHNHDLLLFWDHHAS